MDREKQTGYSLRCLTDADDKLQQRTGGDALEAPLEANADGDVIYNHQLLDRIQSAPQTGEDAHCDGTRPRCYQ